METNKGKNTDKKDWEKTAQDAKGDLKTGRIPDKHTGEQYRNVSDKNRNDPNPVKGSTSDANSSSAKSKEPTSRSSTTDSSRSHKNPNDDTPTGGNVREKEYKNQKKQGPVLHKTGPCFLYLNMLWAITKQRRKHFKVLKYSTIRILKFNQKIIKAT
jgi:hypothetical protein